jgi:cell division septum initiation protein DivIVA
MTTMTKDQEIQLIREFAAKLGSNSYYGPVLADELLGIERDIRADIPPPPTMAQARAYAAETAARAEDEAARRIASAQAEAERIIARARQMRESILAGARIALQQAMAEVSR